MVYEVPVYVQHKAIKAFAEALSETGSYSSRFSAFGGRGVTFRRLRSHTLETSPIANFWLRPWAFITNLRAKMCNCLDLCNVRNINFLFDGLIRSLFLDLIDPFIEEHRKSFDSENIRDIIDEFLYEQQFGLRKEEEAFSVS